MMGEPAYEHPKAWKPYEDFEVAKHLLADDIETYGRERALKEVAEKLGRSFYAVRNRWYGLLLPKLQRAGMKPEVLLGEDIAPVKRVERVEKVEKYEEVEEISTNSESAAPAIPENIGTTDAPGDEAVFNAGVEVVEVPHVKVAVTPITQAQLDQMTESELFELLLNVSIKLQSVMKNKEKENMKLRKELNTLSNEYEEVREGYTSLLGVINTARKLAIEEENRARRMFKMDKNGNLEPIR